MGWLEKIFGKEEDVAKPEQSEQKVFDTNNLKEFLDAHYQTQMNPFFKTAKSKYDEIQNAVDDLRKSLGNLSAAEYTDTVDPRLLSVVVGRRKNFIQKMNDVAKQMKTPIKNEFDSILNYNNSSVFSLNYANATTVDDYTRVAELFRKEASSVISNFRKIETLLTEFGSMVKQKNNLVNSVASSNDRLLAITGDISKISEKKNLIEELRASIKNLDEDQSRISGEIADLEKSKEWKTNSEMLEQRDELQTKKSQISVETTQMISPLVKPVKKFKNLLDNSKENFQNKKFVELFLDDYLNAVVSNDAAIFNSLLEKLEENILNKKIDLKENANKILQTTAALRENDTLAKFKADYGTLSRKIQDLENAIANSQIQGIRRKLEADSESARRKRDELSVRLPKEEANLNSIRAKLEKDKSELELQVGNLTNTKINLDLKLPV